MTRFSGEHMTIFQLQGSTASLSQFSRTPWGSTREAFMPIKACTVLRKILNWDPVHNSPYWTDFEIYFSHFWPNICGKKQNFQVLPSKFIPLGESTAIAELQNKKNNVTKHRATSPLGISIQLELPWTSSQKDVLSFAVIFKTRKKTTSCFPFTKICVRPKKKWQAYE